MAPTLKELIDRAPWREAVMYRDTWPTFPWERRRFYVEVDIPKVVAWSGGR